MLDILGVGMILVILPFFVFGPVWGSIFVGWVVTFIDTIKIHATFWALFIHIFWGGKATKKYYFFAMITVTDKWHYIFINLYGQGNTIILFSFVKWK